MRRRAHLIATAALLMTLTVVSGGPLHTLHNIRDATIEAGARFYGLADILTGSLTYGSLPI
ncbi:hypothetical protein [Nonomuraea sp. NPDC002799]